MKCVIKLITKRFFLTTCVWRPSLGCMARWEFAILFECETKIVESQTVLTISFDSA